MLKLRIRDMREDNDYTQQQVADYLQCDRTVYSRYESQNKDIPIHMMAKLSVFYKTSVDYLLGLTNEKKSYPRSE